MSSPNRQLARHYAEMLVAMVLGMIVLGGPALVALDAAGAASAELERDVPALMLLGMAVTMTVPMVAWMRHRGHGWRAAAEMSAAMFIPAFGVIALLGAEILTDYDALMGIEHLVMLPAMFVAMLLRRDEYSQHAARAEVAA